MPAALDLVVTPGSSECIGIRGATLTKSRRTISGRTAVISGAASGMGRSLAQRLSAYGSPVAITDIDERGLKETEASISGPVLSRVLDVCDAARSYPSLTSCGTGRPPWWAPCSTMPVSSWSPPCSMAIRMTIEWLWNINFHGVVNGTRAFLPILVEQDEGVIVNTSSVFGLASVPNQSAYCSAKFAVRGFTDSLRHELRGTGVTAINVHPGGSTPTSCETRDSANTRKELALHASRWSSSSRRSR